MTDNLLVTKRNGTTEELNFDKIHTVLFWSTENISNVSVSEIEIKTKMQLYNKIPSSEIHETLIKSAANLISEDYPNYQSVAARLVIFTLRKQVYSSFEPPVLLDHVSKCINGGVYDKALIDMYTPDEWERLNKIVKHERDMLLSYAGVEQFRGKYLVQNRTTGEYYETPQMAYILIAAIIFHKYPVETRMQYIRNYYDAISKGPKSLITLPTPLLAGMRTPTKQFSSCTLIEIGDSLSSINEGASSIVDYASRRAGIGIGAGRIRAKGSAIRNGEAYHTGNIPFYKYLHASLKSCSQGGVRGASATLYFPMWHLEAEDLIVLKNNKGTEETRVRHMDYGVQINGYLYARLLKNEKITLFDPNEVPELYEAFFNDQELFGKLYEKYERAYSIRKKSISALEHFSNIMMERNNTGRIYIQNVDHSNTHSSFAEETSPIRMANLCAEICLPSAPLTRESRIPFDKVKHTEEFAVVEPKDFREKYGEIALCTLGSINMGMMNNDENIELACNLIVRGLDELLDYQDYPMLAAGIPALKRRALGVGVCNLAYFIAKHGLKYSDSSANDLINEYAEKMSYYLIKASVEVAKEKGKCDWFDETKYSKGILPIDTYKKEVDSILTKPNYMDWTPLRKEIKEHGMRNSTVMALMPVESCLAINQKIKTDQGIKTFYDFIDMIDMDIDSIVAGGSDTWYSLSNLDIEIKNEDDVWEEINALYYNGYTNVDAIIMEDGSVINGTENHRFKIIRSATTLWCSVINLCEDDVIITYSDISIYGMKIKQIIRNAEMHHTFDLEVPGTHTYQLENGNVSHNSSQVINSTNGIEPPRGPISIKGSKDGALKQVVPEIHKLKNKYEYLWDMPHTRGYLEIAAVFQKWTDQSISTNTTYNPANYPDSKVPMSELIKDLVYSYKLGIKTLYYQNTSDGAGEIYNEDDDDEQCDSCVL